MMRRGTIALLLAAGSACMSLDGLVIPAYPVDAYDLSSEVIPAAAIEQVSFPSTDGTELAGVWVRQPQPRPPLIAFHGNGGPLDNHEWSRIELFYTWGDHDIFTFDYRGFGMSEGPPTRDGILEEDGLAAVQYVSALTGVPPDQIPWIALSLGAAVAAHTNDEIDARAVVLESMFPSTDMLLDDGAGLDLPTGWFFREDWDNLEAVSRLRSPVLVIHGLQDDYIDTRYGPIVYDAAPDPKWLWRPEEAAHANITEVIPDAYSRAVRAFLVNPSDDPLASD